MLSYLRFADAKSATEGGKTMPLGIPRSEEERAARHREFFGSPPPPERLGLGPKYQQSAEILWDLLPTLPLEHGLLPPMPRFLSRQVYKAITGKLPGQVAGKR